MLGPAQFEVHRNCEIMVERPACVIHRQREAVWSSVVVVVTTESHQGAKLAVILLLLPLSLSLAPTNHLVKRTAWSSPQRMVRTVEVDDGVLAMGLLATRLFRASHFCQVWWNQVKQNGPGVYP